MSTQIHLRNRQHLGAAVKSMTRQYIQFMADEYAVDVRVDFGLAQGSYFEPKRLMKRFTWADVHAGRALARDGGRLCFGESSVSDVMRLGWIEYARLKKYTREGESGVHGLWWLIIHEFAHVLDHARNGRIKGVAHGPGFIKVYLELQREFPQGDFVSEFHRCYDNVEMLSKRRFSGVADQLW